MNILEALETEIKTEQRLLDRYLSSLARENDKYFLRCKAGHGRKNFYIKKFGDPSEKYAGLAKKGLLREIYQRRFDEEASEILRKNIANMRKAQERILPWDSGSIADSMPKAFRELKTMLDDGKPFPDEEPDKVYQSENPKYRDQLIFKARSGVYVRSKNEMLIADALYTTDLDVRYEKRLDLVISNSTGKDPSFYNTEVVYPDFTITLPDGSVYYWEHMGLMDQKQYQEENSRKLNLYFLNGIYPPKNLIITVDGPTMPFDSSAVWRIIDGLLLYGLKD